jgi:hypothetical protein
MRAVQMHLHHHHDVFSIEQARTFRTFSLVWQSQCAARLFYRMLLNAEGFGARTDARGVPPIHAQSFYLRCCPTPPLSVYCVAFTAGVVRIPQPSSTDQISIFFTAATFSEKTFKQAAQSLYLVLHLLYIV